MGKIESMKTKEKDGNKLITFELAALFIFSLVVLGHFSVVSFARGYYNHFDVTLADIHFSPQIYDYVNIAPPAFIGAAIIAVFVALLIQAAMRLGNFAGSKTKPSQWFVRFVKKRKKRIDAFLDVSDRILRVIFWLVIISVVVYGIGSFSYKLGESAAQEKIDFSSISRDGENLQKLIIYKNDTEIIVRVYDLSKKQFIGDYEVINGASYITRLVKI